MNTLVLYRPERRERVLRRLLEAGLHDADLILGPDAAETVVPTGCVLSPAEVACYQGHRALLPRAFGVPTLVLEDDFLPEPGWQTRLEIVMTLADRPWDYLNLGRYLTIGGIPLWPGVEDSYAFTTHAYLLSAEGAERFFRALPDPTDAPIDWMVLRLKALGTLSVYTASPRLFRQDRVECPGLIHQEDEPPEFWPLGKPLPWEYPNAS